MEVASFAQLHLNRCVYEKYNSSHYNDFCVYWMSAYTTFFQ